MTSPKHRSNQTPEPKQNAASLSSTEHFDRVVDLVSSGEFPFPEDLPTEEMDRLVFEVRKRRQRRLVQYIARTVAKEIWQQTEQTTTEEFT